MWTDIEEGPPQAKAGHKRRATKGYVPGGFRTRHADRSSRPFTVTARKRDLWWTG